MNGRAWSFKRSPNCSKRRLTEFRSPATLPLRRRLGNRTTSHGAFRSTGPIQYAKFLEEAGYPSANLYKVAGKADTDPLFPDDPSTAPNRRVTLTLMREAPPVPPGMQP